MPRYLVSACLALIAICCRAEDPQYFEGTVSLSIEIESNQERLPVELLRSWYGQAEYRQYRDGDFKIDYEDGELVSLWYFRDENREYWLRTCDDYIAFDDVGISQLGDVVVKRPDNTKEIAGYAAKAIELHETDETGEMTVWRYWYAPDLPINPEWFSEYRVGGADKVYDHIDSLVIGYEMESPHSAVRKFATEVNQQPITDGDLVLPELERRHLTFEESVNLLPCPPCD